MIFVTLNGITQIFSRKFSHTRQGLITDGTTSQKFYHEMFILERNYEKNFATKVWSYTAMLAYGTNTTLLLLSNLFLGKQNQLSTITLNDMVYLMVYS